MNAKEQAEQIHGSFYRILFDSDSDKGEEVMVSVLAKKCALEAISLVLSIDSSVSYWHEVKDEIEAIDSADVYISDEKRLAWVEACYKALTSEKHTTAEEFNGEMNKIYEEFRNAE